MLFSPKKKQKEEEAAVATPTIATKEPGTRTSEILGRMYIIVASADLDTNSCFIESGELKIGDTPLQRKGEYDAFAHAVMNVIDTIDKQRFADEFDRFKLSDLFFEGRSCVSDIFSINEVCHEIRAERIKEIDEESVRARCCIFIRQVESADDCGIISREGKNLKDPSDDDMLVSLYIDSYEINVERDLMVGYEKDGDKFVKTDSRYSMKESIDEWIADGTIHEDSAEELKNLYKPGFLKRNTMRGQYVMVVRLRDPGGDDYRWYEDVFFPVGNNFRVYRRDVDTQKKKEQEIIIEEERERAYEYNKAMLSTLASTVEFRNAGNKTHITHVSEITKILLEDVAERSPQYGLTRNQIRMYSEASIIHDIGKITVPDEILNKPGMLTPDEREIMKTHTTNGAKIIADMKSEDQAELYDCCEDIAKHHHEKYDGKGYPDGLAGENISIGAQVVSMADCYDALVSVRCYKEAYPFDVSYEMMERGECGQFNPRLLESLRCCLEKIRAIYNEDERLTQVNPR